MVPRRSDFAEIEGGCMPRRTKKRSLTADIAKIITTVLHSALGLFLLGVLLIFVAEIKRQAPVSGAETK